MQLRFEPAISWALTTRPQRTMTKSAIIYTSIIYLQESAHIVVLDQSGSVDFVSVNRYGKGEATWFLLVYNTKLGTATLCLKK